MKFLETKTPIGKQDTRMIEFATPDEFHPILELEMVEFSYKDGRKVLHQIQLKIPRGKKIVLLGPNGAGKSTIFQHFNGLLRPTGGTVYYDGQPISYRRKDLLALRKRVGMVFQDPEVQIFAANVYQELSIGPKNFGFSDLETRRRVETVLAETGLVELQDQPPHSLSYGQKKLVSIADLLVTEPEVLILDEPMVWLDSEHRSQMLLLLDRLHQEGKTLIMSTHDVNLVYTWADHLVVVQHGEVLAQGAVADLFCQREMLEQVGLEVPWMVEVSDLLRKAGVSEAEIPRDQGGLLDCLGEILLPNRDERDGQCRGARKEYTSE